MAQDKSGASGPPTSQWSNSWDLARANNDRSEPGGAMTHFHREGCGRSGTNEAGNRVGGFLELDVGLVAAIACSVNDAVGHVLIEQTERH